MQKFRALGAVVLTVLAGFASAEGIPDLSGYDRETRQSMELACISEKVNGPAGYSACLNSQIASLKSSPAIPSLGGYDRETRQSMELACISEKVNGPAAYSACLNRQIASLQDSHGTISSQRPNKAGESQPQRASKPPSQRSSQVNATRPQTAPAQPAKSETAVGANMWDEAIPFVGLLVALLVLVYFIPPIWVLFSSRSRGGAKFGWFIVAACFSWLGLAVFLIVTQASRNRPST